MSTVNPPEMTPEALETQRREDARHRPSNLESLSQQVRQKAQGTMDCKFWMVVADEIERLDADAANEKAERESWQAIAIMRQESLRKQAEVLWKVQAERDRLRAALERFAKWPIGLSVQCVREEAQKILNDEPGDLPQPPYTVTKTDDGLFLERGSDETPLPPASNPSLYDVLVEAGSYFRQQQEVHAGYRDGPYWGGLAVAAAREAAKALESPVETTDEERARLRRLLAKCKRAVEHVCREILTDPRTSEMDALNRELSEFSGEPESAETPMPRCKGGKCPEPHWCEEEQECLWDKWNMAATVHPLDADLHDPGNCRSCGRPLPESPLKAGGEPT